MTEETVVVPIKCGTLDLQTGTEVGVMSVRPEGPHVIPGWKRVGTLWPPCCLGNLPKRKKEIF